MQEVLDLGGGEYEEREREDKHERVCNLFYGFIPNFCCHGGMAEFLADLVHWMILNACDLILLLDWEEENPIAINYGGVAVQE